MRRLTCPLVSGILLLLPTVNILGHNMPDETVGPLHADYQKLAREAKWVWDGQQASLLYSLTQHLLDYETEILCPKWTKDKAWSVLAVRILDDGNEVYSFECRRDTVFTRFGDVLYLAEPRHGGSGCSVRAYDFKAKKQLWKTQLQSVSNLPHSAYHNAVTIENNGETLIIRGNETLLRYIEYVDMKTGKTVAQREFPRD